MKIEIARVRKDEETNNILQEILDGGDLPKSFIWDEETQHPKEKYREAAYYRNLNRLVNILNDPEEYCPATQRLREKIQTQTHPKK